MKQSLAAPIVPKGKFDVSPQALSLISPGEIKMRWQAKGYNVD